MHNNEIMLNFKKIWLTSLLIIPCFLINFLYNPCLWLRNWDPRIPWMETKTTPQIEKKPVTSIEEWSHRMDKKSKWILQLPQPKDYDTWLGYVIALIQITINRILWILAVFAVIYLIYCGFLVLSSWSDDGVATKGKKWIRNAAIAIAWIGLARLIVSAMIRFITTMTNK